MASGGLNGIKDFVAYIDTKSRTKREKKRELLDQISTATISMQIYTSKENNKTVTENLNFVKYWDKAFVLAKEIRLKKAIA